MDLFLIYLICFGVGLLFTLISAFTSHVFGGHDGHVDLGHADAAGAHGHVEAGGEPLSDMPGFSALSPTTIASFLTAFGGFGMIFSRIEATNNPWLSIPLSVLGGFAVAALVFMLFRAVFRRTQSSSEAKVATLAGTPATIITPIPEHGVGEIAYVQSGTRYNAPARSEGGAPISNGQTVKITRVVGTQFYVTTA